MIIAGIDEAGYGPLLGPLVVSATAFEVPGALDDVPPDIAGLPCIWRLLKGAVASKNAGAKGRLLVADSKVVHNLADGHRLLERAVIAFATAGKLHDPTASLLALIQNLGCADHALADHAWYGPDNSPIPRWAEPGDLAIATNTLTAAMAKSRVSLRSMRTAVVSEKRFNTLVTGTNNKASALVSITLRHLYDLHNKFGQSGLIVGVDKQGGREHYTRLLLDSFPEASLKVLNESPESSSYLLTESGSIRRATVVHFREKSEQFFLPTALASMVCKYLREALMAQFNHWWCARITGLRPTAGYYQDGTRWLADVESHLARLKIKREELVRIR